MKDGLPPRRACEKVPQRFVPRLVTSRHLCLFQANTWTPIAPMRTTRLHFALVAVSNKLYAFGGKGQSSIEAYDPMTNEWAEVGEMPEARWGMSFVTYAGAVYIVGGWTPTDACSNDVLRYAPARGEWRRLRPLLPAGDDGRTICATAAVHRQNLYVVGGWNKEGNAANAVRCYNLETVSSS
ncbi:Kelch-like protein 41 [Eumeta japonica]|uniref:Kelch-like protein 41 n=1 Tax=Eumeta variegata TaxID=151549 RepID=A0A4C1ZJA8_EUMVA|nr:Kelch-like protein 41 [Eumeta japonica]